MTFRANDWAWNFFEGGGKRRLSACFAVYSEVQNVNLLAPEFYI